MDTILRVGMLVWDKDEYLGKDYDQKSENNVLREDPIV